MVVLRRVDSAEGARAAARKDKLSDYDSVIFPYVCNACAVVGIGRNAGYEAAKTGHPHRQAPSCGCSGFRQMLSISIANRKETA